MAYYAGQKRKRTPVVEHIEPTPHAKHPYLSGNFAPIHQTLPLTKCTYTGTIPPELAGGEYVRNGSNPVSNEDLGRDAHWFDGDGMLSGVLFRKDDISGSITPEFVNAFVLTDICLSAKSSPRLKQPILPSIATLVNPLTSFIYLTLRIFRTILLVILSHLPGSKHGIKKISAANTNIVFHDGRALATCESGPPIRIQLPGLETVGWYNGSVAENEPEQEGTPTSEEEADRVLGQDSGLIGFMREWTTAHPKVDPVTQEMLMFHSSFAPPYVQYSIVPSKSSRYPQKKMLNAAVPGVHSAKMMHDFGCSPTHTIIMDLPLSLDPLNSFKGTPPVAYDDTKPSRFGVFPRHSPKDVKWFETDASCIFHTANTWDEIDGTTGQITGVNMLCCRLTSATLVFAAGNIAAPIPKPSKPPVSAAAKRKRMPFFSAYDTRTEASHVESDVNEKEPLLHISPTSDDHLPSSDLPFEDQCRLYYYHFSLGNSSTPTIISQYALTAIPFEFPSTHPAKEMQNAQYIYGCSTTTSSAFGAALGKATKIDAVVKINAGELIARGRQNPPKSVTGCVDERDMSEIREENDDMIGIFKMPTGWFAQEPRFVPRENRGEGDVVEEDDGYLLFYAFDESQLDPSNGGEILDEKAVHSELWIVDARDMKTVVGRVVLPQRVPYGLHGNWFPRGQIEGQREIRAVRSIPEVGKEEEEMTGVWISVRKWIERGLA